MAAGLEQLRNHVIDWSIGIRVSDDVVCAQRQLAMLDAARLLHATQRSSP
jgi:hypothetical protein